MRIYCIRCNYKFVPKTRNYSMQEKRCPSCGSLNSLAKDPSVQDILDTIGDEVSLRDDNI